MDVLLYRVDDRLIHGQVVLGWGRRLEPDRLLVVDDRIARDAWERELLGAAAPPELPAVFLTVPEAASLLLGGNGEGAVLVLLETAASVVALADSGFLVPELNLGGIHRRGGRQITPYLFLAPEDLDALRELALRGVEIYAQDVPDGRRVGVRALLDG